jgi:hypothetical protein
MPFNGRSAGGLAPLLNPVSYKVIAGTAGY